MIFAKSFKINQASLTKPPTISLLARPHLDAGGPHPGSNSVRTIDACHTSDVFQNIPTIP